MGRAWVVVVGLSLASPRRGASRFASACRPPASRATAAAPGPRSAATGATSSSCPRPSNLVPGDSNGLADIFLHDRDADADGVFDEAGAIAVTRLNVGPGGIRGQRLQQRSGDHAGRALRRLRLDRDVAAGRPPPGIQQVYRLDRLTGALERVSVTPGGRAGEADSTEPAMSDDGRVVAFTSRAQLTPANASSFAIFIRDLAAGTTVRATWPSAPVVASNPTISADGRRVIYVSDAPRDDHGVRHAGGVRQGRSTRAPIARDRVGGERDRRDPYQPANAWTSPSGRYVLGLEGQVYDLDQVHGRRRHERFARRVRRRSVEGLRRGQ